MYAHRSGNNFRLVLPVLLLVTFISSCEDDWKEKGPKPPDSFLAFSKQLKTVVLPVDTTNKKIAKSVAADIWRTYAAGNYLPVWCREDYAPNDASEKLVNELEDMQMDGINPDRYNLSAIKKLKQRLDTVKHNTLHDAIMLDTMLTRSYLVAAKDLLMGEIAPRKADSLWFHVNDSAWSAPQILASAKGVYHSLDDFRSNVPTYTLLRDEYRRYYKLASDTVFNNAAKAIRYQKKPDSAMLENINLVIREELPWVQTVENDTMNEQAQLVCAYQNYCGLRATGKLDSVTVQHLAVTPATYLQILGANMERIRWMQKQFGDLYLVVDVPLMELFLRRDGANAMHMRVVVGKPERQTPSLYATMANVVINPQWGVPPTILKKDVVPGFEKSGNKYLASKGLKAYDKKTGHLVRTSSLNVHNLRQYSYKQAPGDDNSLGYVKFNLPNPWDIYLHDTPHRGDFGKRDRFLSSGCIRLQQPREMAIYILSELEKKRYTEDKLDSMIETHKTRWELLKTKIPVHITYLTAFEDTTGKHIRFTRDIYQRDEKLISLLH